MKGPSQNRLAPLTHQSKHTSVLAHNIISSKMTAIRFGHRTHRSKRAHKALHRTLSPVTKQFIRTLGDASSQLLNIMTQASVTATSSNLKPACACYSARNLPRGSLALPMLPYPGPPAVRAARGLATGFTRRVPWSPDDSHLRLRRRVAI